MIAVGEVTLNADTLIKIAAIIAALVAIIGYFSKLYSTYEKWQKYDQEIKEIREEQCMQTYVLSSVLDGLHQLGTNGSTTEAAVALEKFINKRAHKMETNEK